MLQRIVMPSSQRVEGSKKNALTASPLKMKAKQTFEMFGTAHPVMVSHPSRPKSSTRKKCYLPLLDTKPSDSKAFTAVLTEMAYTTINNHLAIGHRIYFC
jgi:hypothetical protein